MGQKLNRTKGENTMLDDPKYSEEVTLRKVINKFGKEAQCRQVMEECAELIQAVNK